MKFWDKKFSAYLAFLGSDHDLKLCLCSIGFDFQRKCYNGEPNFKAISGFSNFFSIIFKDRILWVSFGC